MGFDLRAARYFVAVAEELHFGRAAERLRMSQPPLSQAIKHLEADVGATLFERTNRKVELTPAGEAFLVACRPLLELAENVAETPRLIARGHRSLLSIGAVASALTWPLPQAIALLKQRSPGTEIRIKELDTDDVIDRLTDGSIDVALARLASSHAAIRTHVILREEFVLIAPADHPVAERDTPVELTEFADETWVWIDRDVSPDYHDEMASAFRYAGFTPRHRHTARSIASQIAIVASSTGISIVPRSATTTLPDHVIAHPITHPTRTVTLAVSTRQNPKRDAQLLHRCVEQVTRDHREPDHGGDGGQMRETAAYDNRARAPRSKSERQLSGDEGERDARHLKRRAAGADRDVERCAPVNIAQFNNAVIMSALARREPTDVVLNFS